MLFRNSSIGSVAVVALALLSGGFSRPSNKPIRAHNLLQPARRHSLQHCYARGADKTRAPIAARAAYFGGPIIHSVRVVMVLYGSGAYQSFITGTGAASMAGFYTGVTNSPYMDWLSEYNTTSPAQTITRGAFVGSFQISPAASRNGSTISDASIQSELSTQISAGNLPSPDDNTLYMIHFPKGKVIDQGGSISCHSDGFCGYHSTFTRESQNVYYVVLPDMSSGSGCDAGCGTGTPFADQTAVASHEMIEAITDAAVGLATNFGPPLAWYDSNNGEIADICNGVHATVVGGNGVTYTVQKAWSNRRNACIAQ